jgi:hypothetical protein
MRMIDLGSSAADPETLPEFGPAIAGGVPCTPHELFRALALNPEDHPEYLRPAFEFARSALELASQTGTSEGSNDVEEINVMLAAAVREASGPAPELDSIAAAWLAREFAPLGLTDGCWLSGAVMANAVECEVGMALLAQLMLRFGDPGNFDSFPRRYEALLRSVGGLPDAVLHAEPEPLACLAISYERALLGLALGRFPTLLRDEIIGFNLWMAAVGPCPLLERALPALLRQGACLRYFEARPAESLVALARKAVDRALDGPDLRRRTFAGVRRGFLAAQASYLHWQRGVLASLHAETNGQAPVALELAGTYGAPDDPSRLLQFAVERYASLSNSKLYHRFANADRYPAAVAFARPFLTRALARLSHALDSDARLNSMRAPPYSERVVAEIVAANHDQNVAWRKERSARARALPGEAGAAARVPVESHGTDEDDGQYIGALFDGCWLQGFADMRRTGFEEYGWLFRIYASEHGDGDLDWNHSRIFNLAFAERGLIVDAPKTDERLYEMFDVAVGSVAKLAISLDTRRFMPEILGLNLGIEASGVGGSFMETWKTAEHEGRQWQALAARLHNSIDNYADGHTKWSLAAVHSYMRRVKDAAPDEVQSTWHRIWRLWRVQEILAHGSRAERDALAEHIDLQSLVPA